MNNRLPTLRRRVLSRIVVVALTGVGLMVASFLVTLHLGIHKQTDGLLTYLVQAERHDMRSASELHVHAWPVGLPGSRGRFAPKAEIVLAEDCSPLAMTEHFDRSNPPTELCESVGQWSTPRILDIVGADGMSYRTAVADGVTDEGEVIRIAIGLRHDDIDAATWQASVVVIPLALVLLATLIILPGTLLFKIGRDIEDLALVSQAAEPDDAEQLSRLAQQLVRSTSYRTRETTMLARAIGLLAERTAAVIEQQRRFIAEAAHELRTPLTALMGDVDVTLRKERTVSEYRDSLQRVREDADHLHLLAEHLLEVARSQSAPIEAAPFELGHLLQSTTERLLPAAQSQNCTITVEHYAAMVVANELLVERILSNLVINALSHGKPTSIQISCRVDSAFANICVSDDGQGIAADLLPHIFAPFHKGQDSSSSGLGLFLSRQLAERMGGSLENLAAPRTGASFLLKLPLAP